MDGIMYVLPIIAIAAMVVFLFVKFKGTKNNNQSNYNADFIENVNFCITSVSDKAADGTLEVDGIVKNNPIVVGDIFRIVDKDDNIIDNKVVVEKIDTSVIKSKCIDEAPVDEFVTLLLRTRCTTISGEAFLKK